MRRAAGAMRAWPSAARWLVAGLIPFGWLFIGVLLMWAVVVPVGFLLAIFVGIPSTVWYLNWVQDTHAAWVFPLLGFMIATTVVGDLIFGHITVHHDHGYDPVPAPLVVTPAYWQAFGGLLAALAVTVALAIANGERHRGRYRNVVRTLVLSGLSQRAQ